MESPKNSYLEKKFSEFIMERNFLKLDSLIKKSQSPPSRDLVKQGYQSYLKESKSDRVKLFFIFTLKELTGHKPDEETSQEIFEIFFHPDSLYLIKIIIKRLGIETSAFTNLEGKVQKAFAGFIKSGQFKDVADLATLADIKPQTAIVQTGYKEYLEQGKIISFIGLKKETGIEAEEPMIREIFKTYQQRASAERSKSNCSDEDNQWLKNIQKLSETTGIKPGPVS